MWEIDGHAQHYAWGSTTALPEFLGAEPDGQPWAEIWYGSHPSGPSLHADTGERLDRAIAREPSRLLGEPVLRSFGTELPYLLKLIAPARPLSLQVHPSKEHAKESFAAESAAGLPIDSPLRNYRDENHKPEMIFALTRFEAICGFRTPRKAAVILEGLESELARRLHRLLTAQPHAHGMRAAFRALVAPSMRPEAALIDELATACAKRLARGDSPSPRIDRIVCVLAEHYPGDPGVAAALLMNPVVLQPGEAMYVPAGVIHAYLSGLGVEIMAASDNVLRAGLTPKKVDSEEMLQCVSVLAAPPMRVAPERLTPTTDAFYVPTDDFELTVTTVDDGPGAYQPRHVVPGSGPRILLGVDGEVLVETGTGRARLQAGRALFIPAADERLRIGGTGRVIQACVP